VKSARFAKAPSGAKLSRIEQDKANIELLLSELKKSGGSREARFVTTLALLVEGILVHATGVLEGTIAEGPRGANGFGYDPIFVPKGSQKTLAEMTENEKNAISHRARAVQELLAQIKARGIVLAKP
jgi:XTP/dITP diphosphohydrolase